ncbi:MAG: energy transducer TonB [bacterium]|jgi:protein TonB
MGDSIQNSGMMGRILLSPTLRRAFPLSLLLHVLAVAIVLIGIKYWPVAPVRSVPVGMVLDVTEPMRPQVTAEELPGLGQVLAEIPPESRIVPSPAVPETLAPMIPEPAIKAPDQVSLWVPVMPEVSPVAGGSQIMQPPAVHTSGPAAGMGVQSQSVSGEGQIKGGRPIALSEIVPRYPYGARMRGEAGRVTVHVRVSDKGVVESVEVVNGSGHPALDDSAVTATKKARFKPAEQDGKLVPSDMNLQFEFRLEER